MSVKGPGVTLQTLQIDTILDILSLAEIDESFDQCKTLDDFLSESVKYDLCRSLYSNSQEPYINNNSCVPNICRGSYPPPQLLVLSSAEPRSLHR